MSNKKKESKWSKYDSKITEVMSDPKNSQLGYTALAKLVLPEGEYGDFDLLRTYIRRNFRHLKKTIDGASPRVLIYDVETTLVLAHLWWTGKQYVGSNQIMSEPQIITVAWKWLGEEEVYTLDWGVSKKDDKKLIKDFLVAFNSADLVVGVNSDRFDNRWVAARAAKHGFDINTNIKSLDVQKEAKRLFRLPGYSMKYLAEFFGLTQKISHSGIQMWKDIQWGTKEEAQAALTEMIDYNIGDIVTTEDILLRLRKYMKSPIHMGVLTGGEKWDCPHCGGDNVELFKTTVTAAGTIQRIMRCKDDGVQFKLSNSAYIKWLNK